MTAPGAVAGTGCALKCLNLLENPLYSYLKTLYNVLKLGSFVAMGFYRVSCFCNEINKFDRNFRKNAHCGLRD